MITKKLTIEFQHFEGCPNSPKLLERLKSVLLEFPEQVELKILLIENEYDALKFKFIGSPTILLNGEDLLGVPLPENGTLACRFYPNGLPNEEFLKNKIIEKINFLN
jgi:hypothetical protein